MQGRTFITTENFGIPSQALWFAVGSFLFINIMSGANFNLGFLPVLLLFESVPLAIAYLYPRKVKLFVDDRAIISKRYFLLGRKPVEKRYNFSELRDLHLLIAMQDGVTRKVSYCLSSTDHRGFSVKLLPALYREDVNKVIDKLQARVPSLNIDSESIEERYYKPSQLFQELSWIIAFMFLMPVIGSIGFAGDTSSNSQSLPRALSEAQALNLEPELSPECEGKEYCVVAFFADWCSSCRSSEHIVSKLRRYFQNREDAGFVIFKRQTMWGQGDYQQEEWQRNLQRSLVRDIAVPSFVLLKNGTRVESIHGAGVARSESAESFLSNRLQADNLIQ